MLARRHYPFSLSSHDGSRAALGHKGRISAEGATLHGTGAFRGVHIQDRGQIQVLADELHFLGDEAGAPSHRLDTLRAQEACVGELGEGRRQTGNSSSLLIYSKEERPSQLLQGETLDVPGEAGNLLGGGDVSPKKDEAARLEGADMIGEGLVHLLAHEADHHEFSEPFLKFHGGSSREIAGRGDICYMTRNMMIQGPGFVQRDLPDLP
jgi:hypothetical protein